MSNVITLQWLFGLENVDANVFFFLSLIWLIYEFSKYLKKYNPTVLINRTPLVHAQTFSMN